MEERGTGCARVKHVDWSKWRNFFADYNTLKELHVDVIINLNYEIFKNLFRASLEQQQVHTYIGKWPNTEFLTECSRLRVYYSSQDNIISNKLIFLDLEYPANS